MGSASGFCYANDQWFPRTLGIKAEYADYGDVDEVKDPSYVRHAVRTFKRDVVTCKNSEDDSYRNYAVKKSYFNSAKDLQGVLSLMHDERVYVWDNFHVTHDGHLYKTNDDGQFVREEVPLDYNKIPKLAVGYVLVHEFAYQALIADEMCAGEYGYESVTSYELKIQEHIKDYISHMSSDPMLKMIRTLRRSKFDNYDVTSQIGYVGNTFDLMESWLDDGATLETPKVKRLVRELAEMMKFDGSMYALRKHWAPQAGKGSQRDEVDAYRLLAEATLKHCDKVQKEFDEQAAEDATWMAEYERKEAEKKTKRAKKKKKKKKKAS
jgi:hypothetical protein